MRSWTRLGVDHAHGRAILLSWLTASYIRAFYFAHTQTAGNSRSSLLLLAV